MGRLLSFPEQSSDAVEQAAQSPGTPDKQLQGLGVVCWEVLRVGGMHGKAAWGVDRQST